MAPLTLPEALVIAGAPQLVKVADALPSEYSFGTRDATVCSWLKAMMDDAEPMVKKACADHARFWGVESECESMLSKISAYEPPCLCEHDFALVFDDEQGQRICKYAAYDSESVIDASVALYENRNCYPLSLRKQAAEEMLRRAAQHDVQVPEYVNTWLHKAAGFGYMSQESLLKAWQDRAPYVSDEQSLHKLGQFVESVTDEALYDEQLVKHAQEVIEQFDIEHGLHKHYADGVGLPEEIIDNELSTNTLQKIAGVSKYAVTLVNGAELDVTTINPSCLDAIDPAMTKMGADELAAVLPTLPQPDADLLVRLL